MFGLSACAEASKLRGLYINTFNGIEVLQWHLALSFAMAHIESRATPRILISIARATALSQRNRLLITRPSRSVIHPHPFDLELNVSLTKWNITSAGDGDYELQSAANHQTLRVNDQNQLICRPTPRRVTWTIEPRGFEAYVCVVVSCCVSSLENCQG